MKYTQFLLIKVMEECAEVTQRASKAIQFGLTEIEPNQNLTNLERLNTEVKDLIIVLAELDTYTQSVGGVDCLPTEDEMDAKLKKIEKYLNYSKDIGEIKLDK